MNRKMTLTEPDHVQHAREASVRWLLEPSKKEKVKVSFYINPRTDVTYTSKQWIRIPFYDYDENNSCSHYSNDTVFKIIDSDGNVYDQSGKTVAEPALNKGIYKSYKYFNLYEGDYYYFELESGIGKNLIEEPVKIEVREGMSRVINIDHTANEYRLYFEQEDVVHSYSGKQLCNPHLMDEEMDDYFNPYSSAEFISNGYADPIRFEAIRVCKIKSISHNGNLIQHNLIYRDEDIMQTISTNIAGTKWAAMWNRTAAEITAINPTGNGTYNLKIRPYDRDDIRMYLYRGYTNPEDAAYTEQNPGTYVEAGVCHKKSYGLDLTGLFWYGLNFRLTAERYGNKIDYTNQVLTSPHYESFPVKGGLLKGASYTDGTWDIADSSWNQLTSETVTETETESIFNAASAANLLTYAIQSLDKDSKVEWSVLIFDTDKKFKYETWWCNGSYESTWAYAYDNPITSMYFSAVNAVNTIREEQNNE